jgi:hypothetical protein
MRAALGAGLIVIVVAMLAFSACKDDKKEATPAAAETPAAGETPDEGGFALPEGRVSASLDTPYGFNADQSSRQASEDEYPFAVDSVNAVWYQSGGLYVVYFEGFPLDEPLCPGASIEVQAGGFLHAANSPTGEGGCQGVPTLRPAPTGAYLCDEEFLLFLTEVPVGTEGELYASVNRQNADGSGAGMLGHAPATPEQTPEVDLSACEGPGLDNG